MQVPQAIIIVGASRDQEKYGNRAVRAYRDAGAMVYPINPQAETIEGFTAYKKVTDVPPGKTTLASIYTPADVTAAILPDLATYGIKEVFFNPGAEREDLTTKTKELGMQPILACSVTAIGKNPEEYAPQ